MQLLTFILNPGKKNMVKGTYLFDSGFAQLTLSSSHLAMEPSAANFQSGMMLTLT